jgi:hypothetical protein
VTAAHALLRLRRSPYFREQSSVALVGRCSVHTHATTLLAGEQQIREIHHRLDKQGRL